MRGEMKQPGRFSMWSAVILLALLPTGLLAATGWSNPTALTTITLFNLPTNNASIAVGPNGDSVAVWINESNNVVQYARRINGVWSAAKALYTPSAAKGETTSSAHVVLKRDGTALAVFASTTPGPVQYCAYGGRVFRCLGPSKSFAKIATLAPGAASWVKANLSAQGILVDDTQISVDGSDNVVAIWRYVGSAGQPTTLQSTQMSSSVWSVPQTVYSTANALTLPILSTGQAGQSLVAWQEKLPVGSNSTFVIKSLFRDNLGNWNAQPENVANLGSQTWTLNAGVDGHGQATLVWDNNYSIQMSRRLGGEATANWTSIETLVSAVGTQYGYAGPFAAYVPDLAVNAAGDILITWLESDAQNGTWTIESKLIGANATLQSNWPVDTQIGFSYPSAALSEDGSAGAIAWNDNGMGDANVVTLTASNGIWLVGQPVELGSSLWDGSVVIGAGTNSTISAIWLTNTATEFKYKYVASSYQP